MEIKINKRFRKDVGNLESLKKSIQEIGLLHPIVIDSNGNLIAGERRYKACLELGIKPEFRIVDIENPIKAEIDENRERIDFTYSEIYDIGQYINETESRKRGPKEKNFVRNPDEIQIEKPIEKVAEITGINKDTISRINTIFKSDNEKLKKDLDDKKISVDKAYNLLKRQKVADELDNKMKLEVTDIKYRIVYADPPWKYGNAMPENVTVPADYYPPMTTDEICKMPVNDITWDNSVLFLWTTSPHLEESFEVIKSWGFKYKTSFIWDKVKHNMGHYNSVRHELLLVCTKGSCTPDVQKLFDSVVSIERTEHSAKPEFFREIIDTIYTKGNRIELFARTKNNENWDVYGNEV